MVQAGNKAKRLSLVNHSAKTIHHHRYHLWNTLWERIFGNNKVKYETVSNLGVGIFFDENVTRKSHIETTSSKISKNLALFTKLN